jgi:fructokinase
MRKVYAIGETVLDIIFQQNQVQGSKPGGAMLNSSVSLGRAGATVSLISEYAKDKVGDVIDSFLVDNHVDTQFIFRHEDGKTSVAMAFLNEKNDADYVFYKYHPKERLQTELPDFTPEDILLFGSFFGIDPGVRQRILDIVTAARQEGCLIVYDPNFRKPHAHELIRLLPFILENMQMSDIVRGSDEDFKIIFGAETIEQIRKTIGENIPAVIMTKSSEAVFLSSLKVNALFPVMKIKPISTIGAGDNFNAGLIFGILKHNIYRTDIAKMNEDEWGKVISYGVGFASDVCMSYDNYISEAYAHALKS